MDAVEMLKLCEPSPPVPTMSTKWVLSATITGVANSRITCAAAAISPTVSFFTRRPMANAAIVTGGISPLMMRRIKVSISSWKISRLSMRRASASELVMGAAATSNPLHNTARKMRTASSACAVLTSKCVAKRRR